MRKYTFIDTPQKAIIIDNYCENYEELSNNFPIINNVNNQSYRFSAFDKSFSYNKNIWVPFIIEHISKKYLEITCDLLEDHFVQWRPKLFEKIKNGNYTITSRKKDSDKISHEDEYDIVYDFKFGWGSDQEPCGKGTAVHVDYQNKIFQTMIYFPSFGDNGTGGDLHLTKFHQDGSFSDTVKCSYKANRCVIFPHHPSGWHFITPRKSAFTRKGVGVIYTVRDSLQEIDSKFFAQKYK
jgi:hypothetical protein